MADGTGREPSWIRENGGVVAIIVAIFVVGGSPLNLRVGALETQVIALTGQVGRIEGTLGVTPAASDGGRSEPTRAVRPREPGAQASGTWIWMPDTHTQRLVDALSREAPLVTSPARSGDDDENTAAAHTQRFIDALSREAPLVTSPARSGDDDENTAAAHE